MEKYERFIRYFASVAILFAIFHAIFPKFAAMMMSHYSAYIGIIIITALLVLAQKPARDKKKKDEK